MISCTEFIPSYSALFSYIHLREGKEGVVAYWEHISDTYVAERLGEEVTEKGIRGCWDYWSRALSEEAADFTLTLDEDEGSFVIDMHHCPSMGRLIDMKHMEPYPYYCEHCDTLYRRVLEPHGFEYDIDLSRCKTAACQIAVREKRKEASK